MQSNQNLLAAVKQWAPTIMVAAIIGFALIVFRQVLFPGYCLLTTDDNIGLVNLSKAVLPGAFLGWWSDTIILGMPAGLVPINSNTILQCLMPITGYINWFHAIELILASLFFLLFLREQKVGWVAIAAGLFAAYWLGSNFTLTYAGHNGKYGVILMASISLYCIGKALQKSPSFSWSILAGGAIGFMFLEQLDVALFFGFVLGVYALFLAIRQLQANGVWMKPVIVLILMGGIGLMLSVSTMLDSYATNVKGATSMQTDSPQEKWDYVTQWSWPPEESIDFIAPGYTGWRSGELEGPYWGRMGRSASWEQTRQGFMNFKLENTYLGIIPILLALFAILAGVMGKGMDDGRRTPDDGLPAEVLTRKQADGRRRAEIIFWGCVVVITLLLAFGKFFPLYALFYKLPFVNSIRNPNKFLQIFQLALGILAAYGLDGILRARPDGGRQTEKRP